MLVEALDDLVTPADENVSPEAVAGFRAVLAGEHRELQTGQEEEGAAQQAAAAYELVLARVSRWPLKDHGWASLDDGVEDVFRRGRQAMNQARAKGRAEDFHEWRKQVKYLRHQFGLLREVWPDVLEAMEDTADELGERLGADHDLAVLRERVKTEPALAPEVREALLRRIDSPPEGTPERGARPRPPALRREARSPPISASGDCGTLPRERRNVALSGCWSARKGDFPCATRVLKLRRGNFSQVSRRNPAAREPLCRKGFLAGRRATPLIPPRNGA